VEVPDDGQPRRRRWETVVDAIAAAAPACAAGHAPEQHEGEESQEHEIEHHFVSAVVGLDLVSAEYLSTRLYI